MPGVIVKTSTRSGAASAQSAPGASYFVSGITEKGPNGVAVSLRSMSDYQLLFGDRQTYGTIYDDLRTYFEEGGVQAWAVRGVGPAGTKGTLMLVDRAGSPLSTLKIDALNEGAWSTRVSITVEDAALTNTFTVRVWYDGVNVESYIGLATPAAAALAMGSSNYVKATDQASVSTVPTNNPAVKAITALSAGTDDRASVTPAILYGLLTKFGPELGDGAVAIPTFTSAQVGVALIAHATAYNRIALMQGGVGISQSAAKAAFAAVTGPGLENGVFLYPQIVIPDGAVTRTIGAEGFAAAKRAQTVLVEGSWSPPAGVLKGGANFVIGVEQLVDSVGGQSLNDAGISAIRIIGFGGPVTLYGWRSMSTDSTNYYLAAVRDVLNRIEVNAVAILEGFVFQTIDAKGQRIADLAAALRGMLEPYRLAGAFADSADDGYLVDVGPSVNTALTLAANQLKAQIAVRPVGAAETIQLTVVRVGVGTAL